MDWGEGTVLSVRAAVDDDLACEACASVLDEGLAIDVVLRPYDPAAEPQGLVTVCEACFEDLTSDLGIEQRPGSEFLVLVVPEWA